MSKSNLHVPKKYGNIKEELLQNTLQQLSLRQFKVALNKSIHYQHTSMVKTWKTKFDDYLHYGIHKGRVLSPEHLLAIVSYTDYTKLSTIFTSTFRRYDHYEPLSLVKNQNREYANWSRLLREVVEYWGCVGWNQNKDSDWNHDHNRVKGPFFLRYEYRDGCT